MKPSTILFLTLFILWGCFAAARGDAWLALLWGMTIGAEASLIVRTVIERRSC